MEPSYERTVVVGVDGSPEALVAARYGVWQAALRGLDLHLVYSYPLPLMEGSVSGTVVEEFRQAGRTVLDDTVAALVVPPAVALSTQLAESLPAPLMRRMSRSASMVVVGQHAITWYDRLGRGSVASPLAHDSGCPVVVVPPTWREGRRDARPVLVALDGAATSLAALDFAFHEAALRNAEVVALHAVPGGTPGRTDPAERNVAELLARAGASRPGTVARLVTERGETQHVLLTAARSAGVLVVGPPHTAGLMAWTRSVARRVMTSVECPMVVVPRRRDRPVVPAAARSELLVVS